MPKAISEKKEKSQPNDELLVFIDRERSLIGSRSKKDIEEARLTMSVDPVRGHLLAIVDELVRQGIYLPQNEQEGVKMLVKIIGREIQLGDALRNNKKR